MKLFKRIIPFTLICAMLVLTACAVKTDAELIDAYSVRFKEFYNIPVEVTIEIEK